MRRTAGVLVVVCSLAGRLLAQGTITLVSGNPANVPSPTATDYQNALSQFTGTMSVRGNCGNNGDCSLKVQATSSVLALEFKIIARNGNSGGCLSTSPLNNSLVIIPTTPTLVGGVKKNQDCTFDIQYHVTSLAYASHTVAGSPYNQGLTFTITSP